ncbi:MAG: dTMP kinase [Candidatus Omnitrophota bacterium]
MAKNRLKKGIFITLEGVEGCGKSTQAKFIYRLLKEAGYDCILTREPGGTKTGEKVRKILLELDPKRFSISNMTELFLFEANRSQIVEEIIMPALKKKR